MPCEPPSNWPPGRRRDRPLKGERIAQAQDIPLKFLENILSELRHSGLVRSQRGVDGGYWLAKPADEINIADIIRAVEGPLASVRGESPETLEYSGAREPLNEVWLAVRANLRAVLEVVTLADVAAGKLPASVKKLTKNPEVWVTPLKTRWRVGPRVDDLPLFQLELVGLFPRQLRPGLVAVGQRELDPHLEAEVHDPIDHRLAAWCRWATVAARCRAGGCRRRRAG